jgi:type I thyroxine 5'-deiodinase
MMPLARRFSGRGIRFINVYVLEAHPLDGWKLPVNDDTGVCYKKPTTLAERITLMNKLVADAQCDMPFYADSIDNAVELAFEARPERLYVVEDGRVTFRTGPGPYCYSIPQLEGVLETRFK